MTIACLLGVLLLVQPIPPADDGPSSTTRPVSAVAALVAQLAAPDIHERDRAQRALLNLGGDIVPQLKAARAEAQDPDVQLRLDTLIVQVQERVDVGPTRVTLRHQETPLNEVLADLESQTGMVFGEPGQAFGVGPGGQLPRVTIDVADVTLWTALRELEEAANILFHPSREGYRVARNFNAGLTSLRGEEAGAFLVRCANATYSRSISYGPTAMTTENFILQVQMLAEPKIRMAPGAASVTIGRAVDSNGNDLSLNAGAVGRAQPISIGQGQVQVSFPVPLRYPGTDAGTEIRELSGTVRMSIARRSERIVADDLLGGKVVAQADGVRVTIEPGAADEARNQIELSIILQNRDGNDPAVMHRIAGSLQQQFQVTDGRGQLMRVVQFHLLVNNEQRMEFRVRLVHVQAGGHGPYRLNVDLPSSFREIEVPFVLRDLRMP